MSWLDFLQTKKECPIHFGRGIHAEVAEDEEELFHQSLTSFEKREMLDAYEYYLRSLINFSHKTSNENILLQREEHKLHFTLFQGSAKVQGLITDEKLYGEVILTQTASAPVALKRKLLERNYQFTYVNYVSDGGYLKLKLYQDNITMNPQKVFFPLRELALNADFDKEFIASEFTQTPLSDTEHLSKITTEELRVKYDFLRKWIEKLEQKLLTLPSNDNAGMQAFLYLNIFLKIDYLLVPKYKISQKIAKKIEIYFSDEETIMEAKNDELKRYLEGLKEIAFEEFSDNFYNALYTFSPIEKSSYEEFCNFISESLIKIRWYKHNRHLLIIPTIYSYMAFHSFYNYGLSPALKELLHLFVMIHNSDFFTALGCETYYDREKEEFSKRSIIQSIDECIQKHQKKYKKLHTFTHELNFDSMNEFSHSYYQALKNLDFEEI